MSDTTNKIQYVGKEALLAFHDNSKNTFATKTEVNDMAEQLNDHKHTISDITNLEETHYTKVETDELISGLSDTVADLSDITSTNYNESIIGLSIDGQTITYIKGDGSVHTMVTQDTNTEYSLGTDEITGLTKLYATVGSAEDGTMTQKAIKTELDKKVGVTIDNTQNTLIFTT